MAYYDEQLKQLQEQIARARQLRAMVSELRSQREALSAHVCTLEQIKLDEQADVDRLEGRSLAAFFYNVVGKMDEKLDKERKEAYVARVKYDTAVGELNAVERELGRYEAELAGLSNCEQRYETLRNEKAEAIKAAGGAGAQEILKLEERLAFLDSQKKELGEAIAAGDAALCTTDRVLSSLGSAESWGTWDLFGGGLLTDMAKYSHLDSAQREIEYLQSQLRYFKTELADVTIYADIQLGVGEFLRFADYFFDNLFTDWAVMDQIRRSQDQVYQTRYQIESVLSRLQSMTHAVDQEQAEIRAELDDLIRDTKF